MEKTITIDGKDTRFKSNASTPLRFKSQFGKDFFKEIVKLDKLNKAKSSKKKDDLSALEELDFDFFYSIIWVFAKTADKSIPEPITWLDQFDDFPLMDIISEIQELLLHTIEGKKK